MPIKTRNIILKGEEILANDGVGTQSVPMDTGAFTSGTLWVISGNGNFSVQGQGTPDPALDDWAEVIAQINGSTGIMEFSNINPIPTHFRIDNVTGGTTALVEWWLELFREIA